MRSAAFLRWFLNSSGEKCVETGEGALTLVMREEKLSEASLPQICTGRGAPPSLTAVGKSIILTCHYSVP